MVSVDDAQVCPYCRDSGKCSRLMVVQSTWKSAIVLCSDPSCIYPLDKSLHSVARDWSQLGRELRDADKEILIKAVQKLQLECDKSDDEMSPPEENNVDTTESATVVEEKEKEFNLKTGELLPESAVVNEDDTELNELLDYLSNLPNNTFTSFSELPPSRTLDVLNQQNEILKVIALPVIIIPDDGLPRVSNGTDHKAGLSLSEYSQPSNNFRSSIEKTGPRRYPQWSSDDKENNLSWLSAGIALVVHSRLIRCILKSASQAFPGSFPEESLKNDCVTGLFASYETAMRKLWVGTSLCNKNTNDDNSHSSGDSTSGYEVSTRNTSVITFGQPSNGLRIPRPIHQRIVSHLNSCRDNVRQTLIKYKTLANHPADVLAFLLNSNEHLRELSVVSYRTTIDCSECGQRSISFQASRAVTLELPPSLTNFSMIGPQCCTSLSCGLCGVANQVALIEWQTLSPMLFLHFPIGMPENCEFEKLSLELDAVNVSKELIVGLERFGITSRGKYELRVTAVVAVESQKDVNQYVTWVRRGNDFWMPCRESFGPGSCLAEWDPLTAPRTTSVRRCDVRVLVFEAQPSASLNNNNSCMHKSASSGFLDLRRPPSLLHQRYLSIMRQRRKEELHSAANATPAGSGVGSAPADKKKMIQRLLFPDLDDKALLEVTRPKFESYSAGVKSPPVSAKSEPTSFSSRPVKSRAPSSQNASTRKTKPQTRSASQGQQKQANSSNQISAVSLWPQKRPRLSDAQTETNFEAKLETPSSKQSVQSEESGVPFFFEGLSAKDPDASR